MDSLIIEGGSRLKGSVQVSGSKNSSLPLLFSSILFDSEVRFSNVPRLWDVETTLKLLQSMGAKYDWNKERGEISILPTIESRVASYDWVRKMRAGILALGPLVAKYGEAKVSLPGGCAIGARPVNYHIDVLRALGAQVAVEDGYVHAKVDGQLKGTEYRFPEVSVTGTQNALFAAISAVGTTVLLKAAREPEVIALGKFLISCGVQIEGLGTDCIKVVGSRWAAPQSPVFVGSDRIEAGTWIAAAAITKSTLEILGAPMDELDSVLAMYSEMGVRFEQDRQKDALRVCAEVDLWPIEFETRPYPGFATDMQAQTLAVLTQASGTSRIRETIFENRFMHVAELRRLGAEILVKGNEAIVKGPTLLKGAPIMATDLRASASLVLAALAAQGKTSVSRIYHLDRGYQRLDEKLAQLGVRVTRVKEG